MPLRPLPVVLVLFAAMLGSAGAALAQDAASGREVFQSQCSACHSVQPGRNGTGPSLFDVVDRRSGQVAGFAYTADNTNSGLIWTAANLDLYLISPRGVLPHTEMTYPGLKDASRRADLIAYLATLH